MKRAQVVLLSLVIPVLAAVADDSAIQVTGGAVQMLDEHSDVRMVSATITADVYVEESRVRCEYVFRNEGNGQTVTLGFPDMPGRDVGDVILYGHLQDFRSWADGQRLSVEVRTSKREKPKRVERWYVRKLWFGPGQTRKVVNTYVQPNGDTSGGSHWFPYTIWTAGSWKGPIERLDITARWREPYLWSIGAGAQVKLPDVAGPPQVSDDLRTVTWSRRDLEPTREHAAGISLHFFPAWPRAVVNGADDWGSGVGRWFLVYSDLAMAPLRRVARMLDLECLWADGVATLSDGEGSFFVCQLGSQKAVANGESTTLRRAPMLWSAPGLRTNHMYAPIRPICQAFGWQCSLDYEKCAVVLDRGKQGVAQPLTKAP